MRNAEATRERILEAALAEFATHGIAGARIDRIAQAARCIKNLQARSSEIRWQVPALQPPTPLFSSRRHE